MRSRPVAAAVALLALTTPPARGASASTVRASVSSSGAQANDDSTYSSDISANGRFVAFDSYASNLVPGDTNDSSDAFVRDLSSGVTIRVSVASNGMQSNGGDNDGPGIAVSAEGSIVVFDSNATNLVPGDTNGASDIFVHDLETGTTQRVSVASGGSQGDGQSLYPAVSDDGRFVAFTSYATNLVPSDTNGDPDIFVHDLDTGSTERVSVATDGSQANAYSSTSGISGNGRFVAFDSGATNLAPGDTNIFSDVFVHDRATGRTERLSGSSTGGQGNGWSSDPAISATGRYVAFASDATNLVGGDTNLVQDIFLRDRLADLTWRVSVSSEGDQANCLWDGEECVGGAELPDISSTGLAVSFLATSTNLVPGDTNRLADVFVHLVHTRRTARVNVSPTGAQANSFSGDPHVSKDGRGVAYFSHASNLVPGDTNNAFDIFVTSPAPGA